MENELLKHELSNMKDEIRNMKVDYVKIDSLEYRKMKEKLEKIGEETTELKVNFKNLNMLIEKNNMLTETLNNSNTELAASFKNLVCVVGELKEDVKEMDNTVRRMDLETSKNTDSRLSTKQVILGLTVSIIMLFLGAGLSLSGVIPK